MSSADTLELRIGPVAHGGHCVARHEGRVIFVRHAIPGELVRVRLTDDAAEAKFWRADVAEVIEANEHRVPHFWEPADSLRTTNPVGGAEFGHISLGHQRELKSQVVREQLQRLGGFDAQQAGFAGVQPVPGEQDGLHWRTRMAYAVNEHGQLAMNAHRSHQRTAIASMPLAHPAIEKSRLYATNYAGIERVEVAVSSADDQSLLVLLAETRPGAAQRVAKQLGAELSVSAFSQRSGTAADGKGQLTHIQGRTWLEEKVGGNSYRITGEGFWQIHRQAASLLTERVLQLCAPLQGQRIADLYAGAGLFSLPLAQAVGQRGTLYSIEGAPGTHRDAKQNLHGLDQAEVVRGRVERVLHGIAQDRLDAVVLDPPRAGIDKQVVTELARSGTPRICYVSCDPASFARDTARLAARGYELTHLEVHDLYPHTHHMESVGLFERR